MSETLDESVARKRAEHSCLKLLDELMYCMSAAALPPPHLGGIKRLVTLYACLPGITNQFSKYYHDGTYDDCPTRFVRWRHCLRIKLSSTKDAEALRMEQWRQSVSNEHVFLFQPHYQEEAHMRYGLPVWSDPGGPHGRT
eukprot:CAMPEP_0181184440 /NCGR_PEP_ID=MMETSP1096-20121128/8969_1 /TAXON_ID=156174 ORGANISM="Chrysochromulina ericina, Strain CCMP281" /NCGR_SAMPLE_ID=MMETSP1096 /ASSEMBLY_ACC=CAM_ASM_000453 /LENGTH=139 /DNA_ID=CAMNT_0023273205 /DNA_START=11 /DNA_END=429 /DNA_ORIENTATION=+